MPHWRQDEATYFVTFRLATGILTATEIKIVLGHIIIGHPQYYKLFAAIVMPDHVHILLSPKGTISLDRIMKGIKGVSARKINIYRTTTGTVWQDESFDRIVRDEKEFNEKLQYMFNNPTKKGITDDPWNYVGWYFNESIE